MFKLESNLPIEQDGAALLKFYWIYLVANSGGFFPFMLISTLYQHWLSFCDSNPDCSVLWLKLATFVHLFIKLIFSDDLTQVWIERRSESHRDFFIISFSFVWRSLWHGRRIHERIIQHKKVNKEIARVHNLSTPHLFEACKRKHSSATLSMYLEINT